MTAKAKKKSPAKKRPAAKKTVSKKAVTKKVGSFSISHFPLAFLPRKPNEITLDGVTRTKEGRPTAYHPAMAEMAKRMNMLLKDVTDKVLAEIFEVSESTIHKWKQDYPEFSESIRAGKVIADANVVASLYDRATGMQLRKTHFSHHEGEIAAVEYIEELPPDVKAISLWLRNRQGENWKEVFAHTNGQGGAFSILIHHKLHPEDQKALEQKK